MNACFALDSALVSNAVLIQHFAIHRLVKVQRRAVYSYVVRC